ncbi:GNAT family N-acetyltransferase [Jannaschia sp. W003]|uniref:GNAT family N-acetyltransferase n=1 Tax=Jannaschia sp. W003 TaxID=2867012 RepID=UPI0021A28EF5|nr:GNAT family N-acetyltransferase [Jannaschia sp. W003]UWQ21650.1 GNAT family N-acetyltransferase [Jannaschia sp. W003]
MPDAAAWAALHARCFRGPERWSEAAIRAALHDPLGFAAGDDDAFALGRAVAGEAELLTLAVAPERRREGRARALLAAFEDAARARGAAEAFLEVSEANAPARALYVASGWREAGRRRGYYAGTDALVLRRVLGGDAAPGTSG